MLEHIIHDATPDTISNKKNIAIVNDHTLK
jgi:hypothetical protein